MLLLLLLVVVALLVYCPHLLEWDDLLYCCHLVGAVRYLQESAIEAHRHLRRMQFERMGGRGVMTDGQWT